MPAEITGSSRVIDAVRYSEYYEMQDILDTLYQESKSGVEFTDLMRLILKRENILLAYRNIKSNKGSQTPGTDKTTIKDIEKLSPDDVVEKVIFIMTGSKHGYRPKPVRKKDVLKLDGQTRPFGIPCMWDRLVQQCIRQILEPICEAKFSGNSYGFRPNRCAEHAIAESHRLMQRSKLGYAVEFDIKGFFDNIDHSKLIRQIWSLGIHDKKLIFIIKRMLRAPIKMPDGEIIYPLKGTTQGGILSPLLGNIVLNELDHWIDSQWLENPTINNYKMSINKSGRVIKSNAYVHMRKTNLKEMYIIRYADDFRIFCRNYPDAVRVEKAVTQWLSERLKLEISQNKTRIINLRKNYMEFLGFKLKLHYRGNDWRVKSHISDKRIKQLLKSFKWQFTKIPHAKNKYHEMTIIRRYNSMVMRAQNYFNIATEANKDFRIIQYRINVVAKSRLHVKNSRKSKLARRGRRLTEYENKMYGESKALRYIKSNGEPIYPIGYVKIHPPISKSLKVCQYTAEGRMGIHHNLQFDKTIMIQMMNTPLLEQNIEYNDNRLSLYSAQRGKCAITKRIFTNNDEIHCHHKIPRSKGGTDQVSNLILILEPVHRLIHAVKKETIDKYLKELKLTQNEIIKINKYRKLAGNDTICTSVDTVPVL